MNQRDLVEARSRRGRDRGAGAVFEGATAALAEVDVGRPRRERRRVGVARAAVAGGAVVGIVLALVWRDHAADRVTTVPVPSSASPSSAATAPSPATTSVTAGEVPGSPTTTSEVSEVTVVWSRMTVTLEAELTCDATIDTTGTFSTYTIETFSDRANARWLNVVTYPDGSTREVVALASPIYPESVRVTGDAKGSTIGCVNGDGERFILAAEKAVGWFFTPNMYDELGPEDRPMYVSYLERGTRVGTGTDDLGRSTELWEQNISGFGGYGASDDLRLTQRTQWFVDSDTGDVMEYVFTNTVETLGSATETILVTDHETRSVASTLFDLTGPSTEVPPLSDPRITSTPTLPATEGPSTTFDSSTQTTVPATAAPDVTEPGIGAPSDTFVTVSGARPAVIEVRDAVHTVASYDLTCPPDRECVVRSARVMGDTIWVAINDTEPAKDYTVLRARVVSVSRSSGEIVEQLSLDGPDAVRSAGRGADGEIYAHFDGREPAQRALVAVEGGEARVLATGVSGFRLSDDGRYLAVSFSNPPAGEPSRFEVTDLVDGTTVHFETDGINTGPAAWSPDGRYLIVDEQWEDGTAWVVDPWSGSGAPSTGTESLLDGACFMSDRVVASRTWKVGYGQGDAQPGVIRLTSLDSGSAIAEIGDNMFGDAFRCHPDGSVTYLHRQVVEVELSPGFTQLEPDLDGPVELVHIAPDGTTSVRASGDLRIV